jgi:hypothetical protein
MIEAAPASAEEKIMDNPDDSIEKPDDQSTSSSQVNSSERYKFVRDFMRQVEEDRQPCDRAVSGWHLSDVQVWAIMSVLRERGIEP